MAPKNPVKCTGVEPSKIDAAKTKKMQLSELLKHCEKQIMDPDKLSQRNALDLLRDVDGPKKKEILIKALSYNGATLMDAMFQLEEISEHLDLDDYLKVADLLRIANANIRKGAVQILSMAESGLITEILVEHLSEEKEPEILSEIVHALWDIELRKKVNRSFAELVELVGHEEQSIRDAVLQHIKENRDVLTENDILHIGNLLANENKDIRLTAVEALDGIKKPKLTYHLLTWYIIDEKDENVQESILDSLRYMRSIDEVDQQLNCLKNNPRFAHHQKLIEDILDETIPSIPPPDAIRLSVRMNKILMDEEFSLSWDIKNLNKFRA